MLTDVSSMKWTDICYHNKHLYLIFSFICSVIFAVFQDYWSVFQWSMKLKNESRLNLTRQRHAFKQNIDFSCIKHVKYNYTMIADI